MTFAARPNPASIQPDGQTRTVLADGMIDILRGPVSGPVIYASPHSGQVYTPEFLAASRLDPLTLRRSEDFCVDHLFAMAPALGAPLLRAHFPRAYLDVNRQPYELDQGMFDAPLPAHCNTRSPRVVGGLGTIARLVADGHEIYRQKLSFAEAEARIDQLYRPYHAALTGLLAQAKADYGHALLIDCHSMPSIGGHGEQDSGHRRPDFILGDRFGTSADPAIVQVIEDCLTAQGFRVVRNNPYAGGHCTSHYGSPRQDIHAVQIEINRALYMDERRMVLIPQAEQVRLGLENLIKALALWAQTLAPAL